MAVFEVRALPAHVEGDRVRASARLQSPERQADVLWYELDAAEHLAVVERADPFVVAALAFAMAEGCDLRVHGAAASRSLLRNLEEFQRVWHAWFGLTVVDLVAEEERDDDRPAPAVVAFSGGVDSAFSAYQHVSGGSRRGPELRAGLMIHGMDIPRSDPAGFARAAARSRRMLASVGLPLVTVTTNAWELRPSTDTHFPALGVAAALHLVGRRFGTGLLPATASYAELVLPLDSTPLSDRLLGGSSFEIVHDGAAYNRLEKVRRLVEWDEAVNSLRFCLEDPRHDRNCGRCRKCLLTYLAFRVLGVEPRCFGTNPPAEVVLDWARWFSSHPLFVADMRAILDEARARGLDEPWVRAARRRLRVVTGHRLLTELSPAWSARARTLYHRLRRR